MRALFFSSAWPLLVLPFILWMTACNVVGWGAGSERTFSLEYRVNNGLDCAMLQDCGFLITVSPTGELTRYEDPGTGDLTMSAQRQLSDEEINALHQLLEQTGFFDFPALLPTENPKAGGGSVSVTYVAWPAQTRTSVLIMKSNPLPEEAHVFMSRLDSFFSDLLK